MSSVWTAVLLCSAVTVAARAIGPVLAGAAELPPPLTRVVVLLAPALLAGLLVTSVFTVRGHLTIGASAVGLAVAAVLVWRRSPFLVIVFAAAVTTALLRHLGLR